jgi:hypothetical protein
MRKRRTMLRPVVIQVQSSLNVNRWVFLTGGESEDAFNTNIQRFSYCAHGDVLDKF